jgi:hypothetical protein
LCRRWHRSDRQSVVAAAAITLCLVLSACGHDAATTEANSRTISVLDAPGIPSTLGGLRVQSEAIGDTLKSIHRPYVDSVALFSLRSGDTLEATLQVAQFAKGVDGSDRVFQNRLLATLGSSTAKEFRIGGRSVFLTSADRQSIAVWFNDADFFVLSTRADYPYPRGLLRLAIDLKVRA